MGRIELDQTQLWENFLQRGEGLVGAGFALSFLKTKMVKSSAPGWRKSKACCEGESRSKANAAGSAHPTSFSQPPHSPTRTEQGCDIVPVSPQGTCVAWADTGDPVLETAPAQVRSPPVVSLQLFISPPSALVDLISSGTLGLSSITPLSFPASAPCRVCVRVCVRFLI